MIILHQFHKLHGNYDKPSLHNHNLLEVISSEYQRDKLSVLDSIFRKTTTRVQRWLANTEYLVLDFLRLA